MQMLHVQFETIMQKKRRKKKCVDVSTWVTNGKGRGHVDDATGVGAVQFLGPPAPEFDRQSRTSSPVIDGRSGMMPPARARRRRADALDGRCGGVVWVLACGSLLTSKGSAPFYRQRQGGAGAERRLQSVGERAKRPASLHRAAGEIQILNSFFYPRTGVRCWVASVRRETSRSWAGWAFTILSCGTYVCYTSSSVCTRTLREARSSPGANCTQGRTSCTRGRLPRVQLSGKRVRGRGSRGSHLPRVPKTAHSGKASPRGEEALGEELWIF
jgi:hypothetical protein